MSEAQLLEVKTIDVFYGDFQALFGVSLSVERDRSLR
jgi:ABC-type branched-subunit amino acid transport system ATPase component